MALAPGRTMLYLAWISFCLKEIARFGIAVLLPGQWARQGMSTYLQEGKEAMRMHFTMGMQSIIRMAIFIRPALWIVAKDLVP